MAKHFQNVATNRVPKSLFNLSYSKKFTGVMGILYPSMVDEVVPGDVFRISKNIMFRFMPLVSPVMHEINLYEYTFFVPYSLLMSEHELSDDGDFEYMIVGGSTGDEEITIPIWEPTDYAKGSLWDYMGFPAAVDPDGAYPVDFPKRAYNFIWNEYFRDEIETELDITTAEALKSKRWDRDYFTTARPWQQKGTAPAFPITGVLDVDSNDEVIDLLVGGVAYAHLSADGSTANAVYDTATGSTSNAKFGPETGLEVDLGAGAITIDIADFRLLLATQRWMEQNARAGTRYTSFLRSVYGTSPTDERLDRPELIGAFKLPVIISEVLQTESSDASTDLGTMGGHGVTAGNQNVGTYRVKEHGLIMSLLVVCPRPEYSQGIDRQWRKDTLYDFYFPVFANLSEQAVLQSEIYASGVEAENDTIFGYQGRFNEMRVKRNIVCAELAYGGDFDHWTFGRYFSSAPTLGTTFLKMNASTNNGGIRTDPFAASSEDQFVVHVGNIIKAARPLPLYPNPGI